MLSQPFLTRFLSICLLALAVFLGGCGKDRGIDDVTADELYTRAKSAMDASSWDRSISLYKALQTRYPFGRYTEQSMLDLSYVYFRRGATEEALSTLDRFIRTYPTHPSVDYAYYLKGLADFKDSNSIIDRITGGYDFSDRDPTAALAAYKDFSILLEKFPESRYADDARQRMRFILEALAVHEIKVARHYMKIEAYVAALNRTKYVIENYQRTPSVEDALGIQSTIYSKIGMPELANDSLRVLKLNFPDSRYIKKVEKLLQGES